MAQLSKIDLDPTCKSNPDVTTLKPGASIGHGPLVRNRMSNRRKGTSFRNKRDLTLLRCVRNGLAIYSLGQRKEIVPPDSLVVRITAWYGWLLVVLVLMFGAYTGEFLDYCLSSGVKNALSMWAKELGTAFAATGQIPQNQGSVGLSDPFVSV